MYATSGPHGSASGATGAVLIGDTAVEAAGDSDSSGQAEAFRAAATASGALGSLSVYVAAGSAPARLAAGLYDDVGGHPGSLLAAGSLGAPVAGAWNTVALTMSPRITSGTVYWLAILSPVGSGAVGFRDVAGGGASETSKEITLTALPATWTTGSAYKDGPVSAYGVAATVAPDTTPPSVPTALAISAVTQSALTLSWNPSTDDVGVAGYDLYRDGTNGGTTADTSSSFGGLACGTGYTVAVDAFDAAGNVSAQAQVTATTTACPAPDTTPPTAPAGLVQSGSTSTSVTVAWQPSTDDTGVVGYDTSVGGVAQDSAAGTTATFSGLACGGSYTVGVDAYDAAGNRSSESAVVATTRPCDTSPPTLTLTAPAAGASLAGTVAVSADASDDVGVVGVQFRLDGANLGDEDIAAPYTVTWATTTAANGGHTLSAVARDAAGNMAAAAPVAVTVSNPLDATPAPVPAASAAGVTVGGGFVEASARQVLRTAGNVVYVVTADDNPCQIGGSGVIRVEKGTGAQAANAAVPTAFTEQDAANHPISAGVGTCQYANATCVLFNPDSRLDRNGTIHLAYIDTANGNVYYQTFSTNADTWGPRTIIGTNALTNSGSGWPRGGQVGLTLDASDVPHVVYATSGSANSLISTEEVGGAWSPGVTVATGTNLMHPSLVTSLDGVLQLAWLENSLAAHATIGYARYDATAWSTPETVSVGDAVVLANGDDDQGPSIATDLQSRPHVLFMDGTVNGSDDYVRMRVRTAPGTWVDDTPPGGAGGPSDPAGTWYAHTPQNYVSSTGTDFVSVGHDVNISPGGYEYQTGGPGNAWSAYATLDPRNETNTTAGSPGLDGSASIRFDPLRDANAGIIDVLYYDEADGTAGYPHHATVYYKAIVIDPPDTTPPTTPTGLAQTDATATSVTLGWNASSDDVAVAGYGVYDGAANAGSSLSTTGTIGALTCGTTYAVEVDAYDAAGNRSGQAAATATTAVCDVQPPAVTLTAPAAGTRVAGAVAVTASASDDTGVVGVQFELDGADLGAEDTTAPYSLSWDSTTSTPGSHTLTAVGRDAAGNATTSAAVGVTVQNQGPAFVRDLGTATAVNTGGSLQLAVPAGGVAAGHTVVVWMEMSGNGGVAISSITDSRGNSYTADASVGNQGVNTMVGSGYTATPLVQGDKLTVTFSGSYYSLRIVRAAEFAGVSATGRLDQKAIGTGSGSAPATALAPTTTQASELLIGAVGTSSTAALTPAAGFMALAPGTTTGSGVTRTIVPLYRIVASPGQYQAKGTLAAPASWSAALATYR